MPQEFGVDLCHGYMASVLATVPTNGQGAIKCKECSCTWTRMCVVVVHVPLVGLPDLHRLASHWQKLPCYQSSVQ